MFSIVLPETEVQNWLSPCGHGWPVHKVWPSELKMKAAGIDFQGPVQLLRPQTTGTH